MISKKEAVTGLRGLVIFRNLLETRPVSALLRLLETEENDAGRVISAYCEFAAALFSESDSFSLLLKKLVLEDENIYVKAAIRGEERPLLAKCLDNELDFFTRLSIFDGSEIRNKLPKNISLPEWQNESVDFKSLYHKRIAEIPVKGFGIYSKNHVFTLNDSGGLIPVKHPDPSSLDDLYGYETERGKVIANTLTLLEGGHANNVLLYGDAGTGKSSTVKAIANRYKDKGLRLIEIGKNQLYLLPELMDLLGSNPLKFIIFIDDLCFDSDDREFAAFKAILEGSVNSRGSNILIYATSNHRHLVKERMSDRTGEEVNIADTLQELSSLSARFGLTVTFERPGKVLFGEIVTSFAEKYGIEMERTRLLEKAEAFAIRSGGRNARVAKQFIELVNAGII